MEACTGTEASGRKDGSPIMMLAFLAARYGRQIIALIVGRGHPIVVGSIMLLAAIAAAIFYFWGGRRRAGKRLVLAPAASRNGTMGTGGGSKAGMAIAQNPHRPKTL